MGAAAASLAAVAGCSSDEPETPAACLAPAKEYLAALRDAPQPVRIGGDTPIADCLVDNQSSVDIADVGRELIAAATRLNAEAREDPDGEATVELGYLIGAAQEGATKTGGLHTALIRRLDAAARFNEGGEPLSARFERTFGRGYAAGQKNG